MTEKWLSSLIRNFSSLDSNETQSFVLQKEKYYQEMYQHKKLLVDMSLFDVNI